MTTTELVHRSACEFLFRYSVVLVAVVVVTFRWLRASAENVENLRKIKMPHWALGVWCIMESFQIFICALFSGLLSCSALLYQSMDSVCVLFFSFFFSWIHILRIRTHAAHSRREKRKTKNEKSFSIGNAGILIYIEYAVCAVCASARARVACTVYSHSRTELWRKYRSRYNWIRMCSMFTLAYGRIYILFAFFVGELLSKNKTLLIWFCFVPKTWNDETQCCGKVPPTL